MRRVRDKAAFDRRSAERGRRNTRQRDRARRLRAGAIPPTMGYSGLQHLAGWDRPQITVPG